VDSIITRQSHTEERVSEMEDKTEEVLHANNHKEKNEYIMITTYKNSGT
jgi:hypothetical protein